MLGRVLSFSSQRRHSPVPRRSSPSPPRPRPVEYAVKVPLHPFNLAVRDYSEVARRYNRMSISPDFVKVDYHWPKVCTCLLLAEPCCGQVPCCCTILSLVRS
jgi:hypothetical protein